MLKGDSMKNMIQTISMIFVMVLLLNGPALACVGIPDLDFSVVWQEFEGWATVLISPDGSGFPFTDARTDDGTFVDATIHLTLIYNCDGVGPVVNYPTEDMWLETLGGGVVFCQGGSIADAPTDQDGNTQWSRSLRGGGWDEGACRVVVNGNHLGPAEGLTVNFNSPDLDGSGYVNLMEVSAFAEDFFSGFTFRSDLYRDGVLDLSDVAVLAGFFGVACP
jgi:hypothetical protein